MSTNYTANYLIGLARDKAGNTPPPKITKEEKERTDRNANIFINNFVCFKKDYF